MRRSVRDWAPDGAKRPTARANELGAAELRQGRDILENKLRGGTAPVLIFPFKAAAAALIGKFDGNGWLDSTFAGCRLFVMPGPYQERESANATIATLSSLTQVERPQPRAR